jgi:catechol 2,3-dioxygenase-like lactoylglutathione lyase family enzyme
MGGDLQLTGEELRAEIAERTKMLALRLSVLLVIALISPLQMLVRSQEKENASMEKVRVRYMVNDLDPAVRFYTTYLGFNVGPESKPNFAMLERGNLELVLSTPFGPGGAAKPMSDGRKAEPGGWNRIIINVDDLQAEVERLKESRLHFRNSIVSGAGGSEILLDDPSGNPIELFQPAR